MEDRRVLLKRALIRVTSKLLKASKRNLDQYHLSDPEYSILLNLGDQALTLSELSQRLLKVNSNITAIVDHLETRGLVMRVPDRYDRRVIRVRLTQQGLKLRMAVVPEHNRYITQLLAPVGEAETEQLLKLLVKVEAVCDSLEGNSHFIMETET